jgi:flagellar hook-associated protein 2
VGSGGFGVNLNTAGTGLGTGIDVQSTVQQLVQALRAPEQPLLQQQSLFTSQASALNNITGLLNSLQEAVQSLQDPAGPLAARLATSSNENVLRASAAPGTALGSHTIVVNSLATTSSYYSGALATGDTTFGTGQFTLQVGSNAPVVINVDNTNNTLNSLASYINSQNLGVTASVITDVTGARLSVVSNTSGAAGDLTISGNTTGLSLTKGVTGVNASLTVDGVNIQSASNTVKGAIPGVTLNLMGTSSAPVTLAITPDTNQAANAINSFVSAYNAVAQAINSQFTYTPGTTNQPPLFADSTLAGVQLSLANDVNFSLSGNGGITNLASLGVNLQQDGTLSVDSSALNAALNNSYANVQAFFQQSGPQGGFATHFANDLAAQTDPTRGPLFIDLQGVNSSKTAVADEINNFEAQIAQQQQALLAEYSQVNATLQTLPLLLEQIQSQLSGLGQVTSSR